MKLKKKGFENGPIERVIRTVGFVLILLASLFLALHYLALINIAFLNDIVAPVNEVIINDLSFLNNYILLLFLAGVLMLLWTQAKTLGSKITTTVIIAVVVLIVDNIMLNQLIIPFLPELTFINDLLGDFFADYNWLALLPIIPMFILYVILSSRKPKRSSLSSVANGIMLVLIAFVVGFLPTLLNNTWHTANWFNYIHYGLYLLGFIIMLIGSILGILGMFRK